MTSKYPSAWPRETLELISECAEALRSFTRIVDQAVALAWNDPKRTDDPSFCIMQTVRLEDGHVLIDLHGLDRKLAIRVVRDIARSLDGSPGGGIRVVHGGGKGVLRRAALDTVREHSTVDGRFHRRHGWFDYVWDEKRYHRTINDK